MHIAVPLVTCVTRASSTAHVLVLYLTWYHVWIPCTSCAAIVQVADTHKYVVPHVCYVRIPYVAIVISYPAKISILPCRRFHVCSCFAIITFEVYGMTWCVSRHKRVCLHSRYSICVTTRAKCMLPYTTRKMHTGMKCNSWLAPLQRASWHIVPPYIYIVYCGIVQRVICATRVTHLAWNIHSGFIPRIHSRTVTLTSMWCKTWHICILPYAASRICYMMHVAVPYVMTSLAFVARQPLVCPIPMRQVPLMLLCYSWCMILDMILRRGTTRDMRHSCVKYRYHIRGASIVYTVML